jgi:hypothetical protein
MDFRRNANGLLLDARNKRFELVREHLIAKRCDRWPASKRTRFLSLTYRHRS